PEHALQAGADLVISSTHKIVGSLTQSAILHLGDGGGLIDEETVDRSVTLTESTSPSALLTGSLDAARRQAVLHGRELLERSVQVLAHTRAQIRAIDGLDVLDERLAWRRGQLRRAPAVGGACDVAARRLLGTPGGRRRRAGGRARRSRVARHLSAGHTQRAARRATHRRDADLRAGHAAAGRQRARGKRPAAAQRARRRRAGGRIVVNGAGPRERRGVPV